MTLDDRWGEEGEMEIMSLLMIIWNIESGLISSSIL